MLQAAVGEFVCGLAPNCIAVLQSLAREECVAPGTRLFTEGNRHENFHVVLQGHVRLEMSVPGRGSIPLLTVGPGEVLAWSALLGQGMMTASALALDSVRLATLPGDQLRKLCEAQPELGYQIMKQLSIALSQRLLATRLQLLDLFAEQEPLGQSPLSKVGTVDPEC